MPIKSTRTGVYGRCRACRNKRARERYHSSPEIRAAEVARAWRNKLRRAGFSRRFPAARQEHSYAVMLNLTIWPPAIIVRIRRFKRVAEKRPKAHDRLLVEILL